MLAADGSAAALSIQYPLTVAHEVYALPWRKYGRSLFNQNKVIVRLSSKNAVTKHLEMHVQRMDILGSVDLRESNDNSYEFRPRKLSWWNWNVPRGRVMKSLHMTKKVPSQKKRYKTRFCVQNTETTIWIGGNLDIRR